MIPRLFVYTLIASLATAHAVAASQPGGTPRGFTHATPIEDCCMIERDGDRIVAWVYVRRGDLVHLVRVEGYEVAGFLRWRPLGSGNYIKLVGES